MGNIPANRLIIPIQDTQTGVMVSTRSNPVHGHVVQQEFGIVIGNSTSYTNSSSNPGKEAAAVREAIAMASASCAQLGGNAILAISIEIKQFGDRGSYMVVQVTGTACLVTSDAMATAQVVAK